MTNKHKFYITLPLLAAVALPVHAADEAADSSATNLHEIQVTTRRRGVTRLAGAENTTLIGQTELFKAACCNLGESFTTNPSVDVQYADPATGAKQIKLLGLDGSYVQLLTDNMPNFRGAARPYALRYVPGPWMQGISVSKGASSVKHGYEAITGQINVDYLRPEGKEGFGANVYVDSELKTELNADWTKKLNRNLSTVLMLHGENRWQTHDGDGDGFIDKPQIKQLNLNNRWKYVSPTYIFHGGLGLLGEDSHSGQAQHTALSSNTVSGAVSAGLSASPAASQGHPLYNIDLRTRRIEGYNKHAFILDPEHGTNLALIANGALHSLDATYGYKAYDVNQAMASVQLMYETEFTPDHALSAGLSYNYDGLNQHLRRVQDATAPKQAINEHEHTPGAYAQYTYKLGHKLTAMAGIRADWSNLYGWQATPRLNLQYRPVEAVNLRASAGRGHRSVRPWAEYNYLLGSGRQLVIDVTKQEVADNYGVSADWRLPLGDANTLRLNADYYYTNFHSQAVVDYDSDPHSLSIADLKGRSYSHTLQVDATLDLDFGLSATAAWRLNDVKSTYGGVLRTKPLTSRYKGLLSLSYAPDMKIWQFDVTMQLNGPGRLPDPYTLSDGSLSWPTEFKAFPQLNAQVTREFRKFSVYVGGENLTGFRQRNPIINATDPWSPNFDSTMIWGPTHGAMAYAGLRLKL